MTDPRANRFPWAPMLLCALALAGCGGKQAAGGPCKTADDCKSGQCVLGACVDCAAGEQGCGCNAGACNAGLTCTDQVCVTSPCVAGTTGCPCTASGTCEAALTCKNLVCAPCTSDVAGCPCSAGACLGGLVCEATTSLCRQALTCSQISCQLHQTCTAGETGKDAACAAACEPGYQWNAATSACDPVLANCDAGAEASILADCQALHRLCEETATGAECGACEDYFLDEGGATSACRALVACADHAATCDAEHRLCVERTPTADASCGACVADWREVDGTCQEIPAGNCLAGDPASILATCDAAQRACVSVGDRAYCGDCKAGYVDVSGTCLVEGSCEAYGCAALRRECVVNQGCGDCLPLLVPEDPADPASLCREKATCETLSPPCLSTQFCVERADGDAGCVDATCGSGQARREDTNTCVTCLSTACSARGEGFTGRWWPTTLAGTNTCTCETEPGYWLTVNGAVAYPCDADQDGFARKAASGSVDSSDPAIKSNARCNLRYIDRVLLVNEYQEQATVALDAPVVLYESERNDTQADIDNPVNNVPAYVANGQGRRPLAAELNAFTKLCVSPTADYNHNEVADVDESQLDPDHASVFDRFAYFAELHDGWYQAPAAGETYGAYVIRERRRCDADFPLTYSTDSEETDYWRECSRIRDYGWASSNDAFVNQDFAQWSDGTAPAPLADIPTDGTMPPHGLCEVTLPPTTVTIPDWRGMGHSSQFKCVVLATSIGSDLASQQSRRLSTDLYPNHDASGALGREEFNRCYLSGTETLGTGSNTSGPLLTCEGVSATSSDPAVGAVGFVAWRYDTTDTPYTRGCINEAKFEPYKQLCPGYVTDPNGTVIDDIETDFGKLMCGCNKYLGGSSCERPCFTQDTFWQNGYGPLNRTGYWLCARPVASEAVELKQDVSTSTGYRVRGAIPARITTLEPQTAASGANYSVH